MGWADVATKHDLDALRETLEARLDANAAEHRGEMAGLHTELKTEMAELRTELRTEMSGLETGMAGLKTELKTEIAALRGEFHASLAATTRTMVFSLTSSVFLVASFAFGAAYLV